MADKHILYLSYDGLTDPLGSSQVLPYILGLARKGFRYTVVSFEKPDRFSEGEARVRGQLAGTAVRWVPLAYHKNPPVLSTLADVSALNRTVRRIHREDPFLLAHCRSYITSLTGLMLKKKYGVPFLFDMRAFYADERADAGLWKKNHPVFGAVYRYFKRQERAFLQAADHTVVLTHAGAAIMRGGRLTGTPFTGPLSVIPCCADMAHFDAARVSAGETAEKRREAGIPPGAFVLGYSGSVGTWYLLPDMLDFFRVCLRQRADSIFLLLTRDRPEEIWNLARAKDIPEQSIRIRPVTRDEMPAWLSVFDRSVFFILPSFSKQASSPTKQGELMGMGIPVVCNAGVGDTESIVEQSGGGTVVHRFTEDDYRAAAAECLNGAPVDREGIRRYGMDYYGLDHGTEQYRRIYASLLDG